MTSPSPVFIGSDIVALGCPDNLRSARSIRYRTKVLNDREIRWLSVSRNIPIDFLKIWAMKESVYKVLIKQGYSRFNSARKIEVHPPKDPAGQWMTSYDSKLYYGRVQSNADYIFAEASTNMDFLSNHVIVNYSGEPTPHMIELLFEKEFGASPRFSYSKHGIPMIEAFAAIPALDLSVSHDGAYFSYSYILS